jgi:hypothetical protein
MGGSSVGVRIGVRLSCGLTYMYFAFFSSRSYPVQSTSAYSLSHSPSDNVWSYQDISLPSDLLTCQEQRSRLAFKITPHRQASHTAAAVGNPALFGETCLTYQDRFSRYTAAALGIHYGNLNESQEEPVLGPIKPADLSEDQWTSHLRERTRKMNNLLSDKQLTTIINWRALQEGCGLRKKDVHESKKTAVLLRLYEGYVLVSDHLICPSLAIRTDLHTEILQIDTR